MRNLLRRGAAAAAALTLAAVTLEGSWALERTRAIDYFGAPGWVFPGASLDFNFVSSQYWQKGLGQGPASGVLSVSRASTGLASDASGNWSRFGGNVARITNQGLLIEEGRTNLLLQSSALADAAWGTNALNITGGQPDPASGTTAALLVPTTANTAHFANSAAGLTLTAASYSWSMFLKPAGYDFAVLTALSGAGAATRFWAVFDLTTGAVALTGSQGSPANTAASATLYPNGWVQVQVQMSATADAGDSFVVWSPVPNSAVPISSGNPSFAGDGVSGAYTWNPQLELGSFASSPIPTTGSAAARAADFITVARPPLFGGNGSTMLVTATPNFPNAYATTQTPLQIDEGDNDSRIEIDRGANSGSLGGRITVADTPYGGPGTIIWGQSTKITTAYALQTNDQAVVSHGTLATYTGTAPMFTPSRVVIGADGNGGHQFNGTLQRLALWPTQRLPNAFLMEVAP